jgi:arginyl-tRNA synthetase
LPEVLQDVVRTWEVQRLPQYALELAAAVHRFYDTVPVLQAGETSLLRTRLALVVAVRTVLAKVFDLLGVERREVM